MFRDQFPELYTIIGGYFNQDYIDEGENTNEIIEKILSGYETPDYLRDVLAEINQLLSMSLTEEQLVEIFFKDFGAGYDPRMTAQRQLPDTTTIHEWFVLVRDLLTEGLKLK